MSSGNDYTLEDDVHILFTTRAFSTGIPGTLSTATVAVYEDVTATPILTSVAVTEDLNSITGLNAITIAATAANGFNVGGAYHVVIEAGTVDSVSVVGEVVGNFTVGHSAAAVDLANGTDGLGALKTLIDTVDDFLDTEIAAITAAVITNAVGADIAADIATAQADLDTITGTAGVIIDDSAANDTTISDAVWDEAQSSHVGAGTFGVIATEIADILTDTAEIGVAGAGLTDLGGMSTAMQAEVLAEVNTALDTAIAELGVGAPTATPTLRTGLMLLYMALRNKTVVQTSGTDALEIYNDAGTKIAAKLLTDDGSDYTEAEMA